MIETVLPEFLSFCEGAVLVAHNANFDMSFIKENAQRQGLSREFTYVDTVGIARVLLPHQAKHTLDAVAKPWEFPWKITTGRWMTPRRQRRSL